MTDEDVLYKFSPPFDGAFLRGVPKRDLTQRDVDRLDAQQKRDAFAPHPGYGTPLYTAVGGKEKTQQEKAMKAAEKDAKEATATADAGAAAQPEDDA